MSLLATNGESPESEQEIARWVATRERIVIRAGNSKWGPRQGEPDAATLDLGRWSGVLEYEPTEFTLTARSGTPLAEISQILAANGQYLPFDPLLSDQGATLGGTLACGVSGPGRLRYGGARDFVLGLRFVDGQGEIVRGGGKVVKNAAGFDLPKLFVGSCGTLGAVLEWTVKVFPHPQAKQSFWAEFSSLDEAMERLITLTLLPFDLDALDLFPATQVETGRGNAVGLRVRMAGEQESIDRQWQQLKRLLPAEWRCLEADSAQALDAWIHPQWCSAAMTLLKVPTTVRTLKRLVELASSQGWHWRTLGAGQGSWLAVPESFSSREVSRLLSEAGYDALVVRTQQPQGGRWGNARSGPFATKIKRALDPSGRFGGVWA